MNKYGSLISSAIFSFINLLSSYSHFRENFWNELEIYTEYGLECTWFYCFLITFFIIYATIQSIRIIWYTHSFLEYIFYRISKLDKD